MSLTEGAEIEAYRQAFENYRHYATLRFALLTAFIAIMGGLFALAFRKSRESKTSFWFTFAAGIAIALAFAGSELRINQLMGFFFYKAYEIAGNLGMSDVARAQPRATYASPISGPVATLTIYFGSVAMWIVAALLRRYDKL